MNRIFWTFATIAAMGLGSVSAVGAQVSKTAKHAARTHVLHHAKAGAKVAHTAKASAKSHKPLAHKPASHKSAVHSAVAKNHGKTLSRLEKRRA